MPEIRLNREVVMKLSRFIRFFTVLSLIFFIISPLYSASKKKAKNKSKNKTEDAPSVETTSSESLENDSEKDSNVMDSSDIYKILTGSDAPENTEDKNLDNAAEPSDNSVDEASDTVKASSEKEKDSKKSKKKAKKKSEKEIQKEKNNFSGWVEPRGRSIEETFGSIKLRIRNRIGSFNLAIVDEEEKKTMSVLSTADEYTTSGFSIKIGKKIIELNKDSSVRKSAWKTDTGVALGYRIENLADIIVYFDVFASSPDYDTDSVKVTVKVSNMSKKKEYYAIKVLLDTILGETDRHHFYDSKNAPVKNEIAFRDVEDNKWFVSKNSSGALQIIVGGGDCTQVELVALANYSTLDIRNWEPDLLSYRAFDTVLAYNNSAVGITWPRHRLGAGEQFTEVFYMSTALGDRIPSGASFILGIEPEVKTEPVEEVQVEQIPDSEEPKVEEVQENTETPSTTIPPYVPFDVKTITKQQLSPEYIQKLLDKIAALEESDDSIDREELILLNSELDAILEALRL